MDHNSKHSDYLFLFLLLLLFAKVCKRVIFLLLGLFCNDILGTLMVTEKS